MHAVWVQNLPFRSKSLKNIMLNHNKKVFLLSFRRNNRPTENKMVPAVIHKWQVDWQPLTPKRRSAFTFSIRWIIQVMAGFNIFLYFAQVFRLNSYNHPNIFYSEPVSTWLQSYRSKWRCIPMLFLLYFFLIIYRGVFLLFYSKIYFYLEKFMVYWEILFNYNLIIFFLIYIFLIIII